MRKYSLNELAQISGDGLANYPYRAYEFIEFYKLILDQCGEVSTIMIEPEDHTISLIVGVPQLRPPEAKPRGFIAKLLIAIKRAYFK